MTGAEKPVGGDNTVFYFDPGFMLPFPVCMKNSG
jgi:hypothetical protein